MEPLDQLALALALVLRVEVVRGARLSTESRS
jgi:hypothetical protein